MSEDQKKFAFVKTLANNATRTVVKPSYNTAPSTKI